MKICLKCDHNNPDEHSFCEECGSPLEGSEGGKDPLIGKMISGKFEILELIGQGAMGKVYKAVQHPIEREVAIKILHPHLMEDKRVAKRFAREAQAASKFNHPNSIQIFDFGQTEDGSLYIAMEFITGTDLAEVIAREAPLSPSRAVHIAVQALSALQIAHLNKIIHRDLKPENIMLEELPDNKDFVKVCDFGIAKIQQPAGSNQTNLTVFGMICGTPYYMSPEQARGEELDGRTDLYSMGVILYEMLTGEVPFHGSTPVEVIAKHLTEKPKPISQVRPDLNISPKLEAAVMKALEKDRNKRYSSAQEMANALEKALEEESLAADLKSLVKEVEEEPPIVVGKPIEKNSEELIKPVISTPEPAPSPSAEQKAVSVAENFSPPAQASDRGSELLLKEESRPRVRQDTPPPSYPSGELTPADDSGDEYVSEETYPDLTAPRKPNITLIAASVSGVVFVIVGVWLFFLKSPPSTSSTISNSDPVKSAKLPKLGNSSEKSSEKSGAGGKSEVPANNGTSDEKGEGKKDPGQSEENGSNSKEKSKVSKGVKPNPPQKRELAASPVVPAQKEEPKRERIKRAHPTVFKKRSPKKKANLSPREEFDLYRRRFSSWMKRERISKKDLPPKLAQYLLEAKIAALKDDIATAAKRYHSLWSLIRKRNYFLDIVKKKYERLEKEVSKLNGPLEFKARALLDRANRYILRKNPKLANVYLNKLYKFVGK